MDANDIEVLYTYLSSQQTARHYLYRCYQKLNISDAEIKSYENCTPFMYYLEHGHQFYNNGKQMDYLLQPILYFYGMIHLLKAALLTKRPDYPESTSMLAHGVSTRKRKKKNYTFLDDEVKPQHKGLFPYFSEHLFLLKKIPFSKIKMHQLLAILPELSGLFRIHDREKMIKVGTVHSRSLTFPCTILDDYNLTENTFIQRIKSYAPDIDYSESSSTMIDIRLKRPIHQSFGPFFVHMDRTIYFPKRREHFLTISEVMAHYLLLYNLSMLSRYEAEWWGELLMTKSELDFPFISSFLNITAKKVPLLIGKELLHELESF
ncbi:MAG TPA: YaaC family protein [Bacillota bacterium]